MVARISKPSSGKGQLPRPQDASPVVGQHTNNPDSADTVLVNFRVPLEFRTALKTFAASHNQAATAVVVRAVREFMERVGSDPDAFKD